MSKIEIKILEQDAALDLAPLISSYAQERKRGAPRQPDMFYAETLLNDRTAEVLGAYVDGKLSAFCTFFDLPETISGKRVGHVDILYVDYEARDLGVTKAVIEELVKLGDDRNWLELQWNDPNEVQQSKISEISRLSTAANVRLSIGIHEEHTKVQ
ncbi:GNAT family N-acetyltransferase [Cohaesibacter celericrescens]|uniref:GNAT family N-acetyltransferase n=1 Tax=Cohaesibacter celericrescens TaxID=2067669 RepID=A0A2N5XP62_9HYPH|nr:GNAT family N-acetyltransferase [Cohaesibacter celericrescens]PLW76283.1 GNAT family N-acetyltransferase [Cohaesibacter celericrescens]